VDQLDLLADYVDAGNYARTCLYLTSTSAYLPEPDDHLVLVKARHQPLGILSRHQAFCTLAWHPQRATYFMLKISTRLYPVRFYSLCPPKVLFENQKAHSAILLGGHVLSSRIASMLSNVVLLCFVR